MQKSFRYLQFMVLLLGGIFEMSPSAFSSLAPGYEASVAVQATDPAQDPTLKEQALAILQTKCNVCHKKKNPFKVFSSKNVDKHAPKIYKQVFVYRRMPKGSDIKLTETEYQILKDWLQSKNLF